MLSSPLVDQAISTQLGLAGVQIVGRVNIGLCLGAYRDLALLLHSTPTVLRQLKALVFCNDSNLLVQSPEALVAQLEQWTKWSDQSEPNATNAAQEPILAGLTDSAQRNCYHLQSFLLHANQALLQHPAWLRFWLHYAIDGSKDDLINQGKSAFRLYWQLGWLSRYPFRGWFTNGSCYGKRAAGLWHCSAGACQSEFVCLA